MVDCAAGDCLSSLRRPYLAIAAMLTGPNAAIQYGTGKKSFTAFILLGESEMVEFFSFLFSFV